MGEGRRQISKWKGNIAGGGRKKNMASKLVRERKVMSEEDIEGSGPKGYHI